MWPLSASRRPVIASSIARNSSTEISRSPWRISTNRDMCVPLKLCGRLTYMLKVAIVCCSPAERSFTRTGWLMSLMPTRLIGSWRVSRRPCTSSTSASTGTASLAVAGFGVMSQPSVQECAAKGIIRWRHMAIPRLSLPGFQRGPREIVRLAERLRLMNQVEHNFLGRSCAACRADAFVGLQGPPAFDAAAEARRIEAGGREAAVARAVLDEAVGDSQLQQRDLHTLGCQQLAHGGAGTAARRILLDGHDGTVARGELDDQILVEGIDERHVEERGIEPLRDLVRRLDHRAECQQRESAAALTAQLGMANRQGRHLGDYGHARTGAARVAHDARARQRARGVQHLPAFVLVRRRHDHH